MIGLLITSVVVLAILAGLLALSFYAVLFQVLHSRVFAELKVDVQGVNETLARLEAKLAACRAAMGKRQDGAA